MERLLGHIESAQEPNERGEDLSAIAAICFFECVGTRHIYPSSVEYAGELTGSLL
jgi:hypothetical protein